MKADIEAGPPNGAGALEVPGTSAGRSWYAVGVLLVAYVFSVMDRQILTLLVGPIQQTLHVNDTLMGMLHGFTFAAFYALMGLPIARIIDRGDRRLAIAVGIALWSLATAAGGLATEYWHLLLARVGVAVGEAVLLPGAVSLIADLFAAEKRGRAMSVFGASGPFGAGAGLIAGGLILGIFTLAPPSLPWFGALHPWQATFMALGLPGLFVALLMLSVPEPRNAAGGSRIGSGKGSGKGSQCAAGRGRAGRGGQALCRRKPPHDDLPDARRRLLLHLRIWLVRVGADLFRPRVRLEVLGDRQGAWIPARIRRPARRDFRRMARRLLEASRHGARLLAGRVRRERGSLHVGNRHGERADAHLALGFVGLASFFTFFLFGAGPSAIQEISPAPMRGQFAALYTGVLNLLGAGCGPVAVGVLTDYVLRDPMAIGQSIAIVSLIFGSIACVLFRRGFRAYRDTLGNAADWRPAPAMANPIDTAKVNAVAH